MIKQGLGVLWVAVLFAVTGAVSVASAEEYPDGCVSCHAQVSGKADFRLNYLLTQIGHRWIKTIKQIPRDCTKCHSGDDQEQSFMSMIHEIHYDVPKANLFVTRYGGECLNCHSMDVDTGAAALKGGPRNW